MNNIWFLSIQEMLVTSLCDKLSQWHHYQLDSWKVAFEYFSLFFKDLQQHLLT